MHDSFSTGYRQLYVEVDDGDMIKQGECQLQDMILAVNQSYASTPNITVEPNQCYGPTTPSVPEPDELYVEVDDGERAKHASRGMELMVNQAYAYTPNIPMEPGADPERSLPMSYEPPFLRSLNWPAIQHSLRQLRSAGARPSLEN
jgi:hypothetical protein